MKTLTERWVASAGDRLSEMEDAQRAELIPLLRSVPMLMRRHGVALAIAYLKRCAEGSSATRVPSGKVVELLAGIRPTLEELDVLDNQLPETHLAESVSKLPTPSYITASLLLLQRAEVLARSARAFAAETEMPMSDETVNTEVGDA